MARGSGQGMIETGRAPAAETACAAFDAAGRALGANPAWEDLAPDAAPADEMAALAAVLAAAEEIRGYPASDPRSREKARAAWASCAGGVEALGPDGRWRLLSAHRGPDGGRTYHAVDITQRDAANALAGRLLVENPMAIWAVDARTGAVAFANHEARRLFASSEPDDARLSLVDQFLMPHHREQIARGEGGPQRVDFVDALVQTQDGRRLWTAGATKRVALGGHILTLCAMLDTTESTQDEHEITRALELLTDAFQALDEGLVLFDPTFRFVLANRRYLEMFHARVAPPTPGEPVGEIERRLVAGGHYRLPEGQTPEGFAEEILASARTEGRDVEFTLADGRTVARATHATSLGGFLVTFTETTAQHRAERAEAEADMLVRTIVESSPTTFLVTRVSDGKILYMPEASRALFGDADTSAGFFVSPGDRDAYLAALQVTGALTEYPVRLRRADGSVMHGLTSARVVDFRGEDVIVSATRDITEQLAMQEELERQREIAHQNEKLSALGELLAGVSHELNNPLSIIVGYALMLQDKVEDPALRRRVDRIAQAAERCTKIVRTFLAMARKRPVRVEDCALNEVVEVAVDVAGYGLRSTGAEVSADLDPHLPPISADPDQLAQVFTNLIVNAEHALTHLGPTGRLRIATYHDAERGQVVAEVSDNGPGMAPEIRARIFEPFFTTKAQGKGTGIGLAFCHRVVESHGGQIAVSSEPGRGATFWIRLPAAAPAGGPRAAPPGRAAEPGGRRRVLVVDDEPEVAQVICEMLSEQGYVPEACASASAALARLAAEPFDAILSDVKMPGTDGGGLLAALARIDEGLVQRLGFVTGDTMGEAAQALLLRAGRPHLAKPLDPEALARLVAELCRGGQPAPAGPPAEPETTDGDRP